MSDYFKNFKVIIPAELSKGEDGEWIVQGLASTSSKDQQGEIILPSGIDTTPIDEGRGILNWDHQKGPENIVGLLDSYKKDKNGFFIKGRLLKNHQKAKSIHEIMSSLGKSDKGRMGLSVEGKILERGGKDGKLIKKCQINAVALTMNPVNQDSYVDLVKSLTNEEVEFQATEENLIQTNLSSELPVFTATQVLQLMEKALGIGAGPAMTVPGERTGGDAIAQENMKTKKEPPIDPSKEMPPPRLKKCSKEMYKSFMTQILNKIHELYPNNSKEELWTAIKTRLSTKFPSLEKNG